MRQLVSRKSTTTPNKQHYSDDEGDSSNSNKESELQQHVTILPQQSSYPQTAVSLMNGSPSMSRRRIRSGMDVSISNATSCFDYWCFRIPLIKNITGNGNNKTHVFNGHHSTASVKRFRIRIFLWRNLIPVIVISAIALYCFLQLVLLASFDTGLDRIKYGSFLSFQRNRGDTRHRIDEERLRQQQSYDKGPPIVAIFYNLYIPPEKDKNGVSNALGVIHEQIRQIGISDLFLNHPDDGDQILLYFNTIGNFDPISFPRGEIGNRDYKNLIEKWCFESHPKLRCMHLKHYTDADESITLQAIYDYCTDIEQDQQQLPEYDKTFNDGENFPLLQEGKNHYRVVYLHSKGSYHPSQSNDAWRRALTAAALHEDCIDPPLPDIDGTGNGQGDTCNLCGLTFYTQFTMFVPGNMWTASCSYVRQLLPPRGGFNSSSHTGNSTSSHNSTFVGSLYELRREQAVTKFFLERARGRMDASLMYDRVDFYGLDRYSSEHWIGSHPSLIPCDVDPVGDLYRIIRKSRSRFNTFTSVLDIADHRYHNRHEHRLRQRRKHVLPALKRQQNVWNNPKDARTSVKGSENDNDSDDDDFEYDLERNKRIIEKYRRKRDRNIMKYFVSLVRRTLRDFDRKARNHDRDHVNMDEYGFRYQLGPRHPGNVLDWNATEYYLKMIEPHHRHLEYYLLPGNILKWSMMYPFVALPDTVPSINLTSQLNTSLTSITMKQDNTHLTQYGILERSPFKTSVVSTTVSNKTTTSNSWIWNWFPDGDFWREGIIKNGMSNVISAQNFQYTFHLGVPDHLLSTITTAFYDTNTKMQHVLPLEAHGELESRPRLPVVGVSPTESLNENPLLNKDYAFFYHITLYSTNDNLEERDNMQLIEHQLHIVATSFPAIESMRKNLQLAVFYSITNPPPPPRHSVNSTKQRNDDQMIQMICARYPSISCQLLNIYYQDYEGETLREIHNVCSSPRLNMSLDADDTTAVHPTINDNTTIIYINNQGPIQLRQDTKNKTRLFNLIIHATMAVADRRCVQMQEPYKPKEATFMDQNMSSRLTCNVCGLKFYTIWTFFFAANMFTTTCSYIRRLLPPPEFEYQMSTNVVGNILLSHLRGNLVTKFLPSFNVRPDYLGLDRYAIDHWIGSHPTIRPCDLTSKNLEFWWERNAASRIQKDLKQAYTSEEIVTLFDLRQNLPYSKLFDWSLSPRSDQMYNNSNISVPTLFGVSRNQTLADIVEVDAAIRRREFHLLAGNVLKWSLLYTDTVVLGNEDSWIWSWYPDGSDWKQAINTYGVNAAVQQFTSPYVTKE